MRILITGGAGMLGQKLVARLAAEGMLGGRRIGHLLLQDVVPPAAPAAPFAVETRVSDLSAEGEAAQLVAGRPEVVFHLAGIVSGEAEEDFALGYRVNLDGTRALWDAIRLAGHAPRVVFASTNAVFGGPFPDVVPDDFAPVPLSSYGAQKLIAETLLTDYSRRGFLDGIALRLPTICVRPGRANRAASSFFSAILREPLNGQTALLPVPRDVVHFFASPRAATGFFLHAATVDTAAIGPRRALSMPGVAASVAEQIAALARIAPEAPALIREGEDPAVWAIVRTWPKAFEARRAREAGFVADADFDAILAAYVEDDLGGRLPGGAATPSRS